MSRRLMNCASRDGQQDTTLRAYLYHWSVLRCGSSSEERRNGSTCARATAVLANRKCRVSGNPRLEHYFSSVRAWLKSRRRRFLRDRHEFRRLAAPDCDHLGRVLGSTLFLLFSFRAM